MIDRDHKLPLARQAKAVGISRGSIYYRPRSVGEAGLGLMRRIDELHLEYPFAGSRMMRGLLRQEGLSCGRRHIATLMRRMGIEALYRKPNTSRRRPGHTVYPYLLRGLEVSRPNQVWAMDITYIPMARGFVYLAAVMDWHSRKVLAWRVSVTMDTDFCVEALEESLGRHGAPEIFNGHCSKRNNKRDGPCGSVPCELEQHGCLGRVKGGVQNLQGRFLTLRSVK